MSTPELSFDIDASETQLATLRALFCELDANLERRADVYELTAKDTPVIRFSKGNDDIGLLYERHSASRSVEEARSKIVNFVLESMPQLSYDAALKVLCEVGLGTGLPNEATYLSQLGMHAGVAVRLGKKTPRVGAAPSMTLLAGDGGELLPCVYFETDDGTNHFRRVVSDGNRVLGIKGCSVSFDRVTNEKTDGREESQ